MAVLFKSKKTVTICHKRISLRRVREANKTSTMNTLIAVVTVIAVVVAVVFFVKKPSKGANVSLIIIRMTEH